MSVLLLYSGKANILRSMGGNDRGDVLAERKICLSGRTAPLTCRGPSNPVDCEPIETHGSKDEYCRSPLPSHNLILPHVKTIFGSY